MKAVQKRTLQTRARLIRAAKEIIRESGYSALRVEEVVSRAKTAKGTFFAHFTDKEALMDLVIGGEIDKYLDDLVTIEPPHNVDQLADALDPLCRFMTCERYVFDVILRYSGAAGIEEIGAIATTFCRQETIFTEWLSNTNSPFRKDISVEMQAEGVAAFMIRAMVAYSCGLQTELSICDSLKPYLKAWLKPAD